jgi:hypothetical protein
MLAKEPSSYQACADLAVGLATALGCASRTLGMTLAIGEAMLQIVSLDP